MAKNKTKPKKECIKCKRVLVAEINFYKCESSHLFPDGRFHLCVKCVGELMETDDAYDIALAMLHSMNKPMIIDRWNSSKGLGDYLRQISSLPNFSGLTWKHSDFKTRGGVDKKSDTDENSQSRAVEITEKIIEKYGAGYTDDEYYAFERKYNKLIKNYSEQTAMHSEGLISYIRFRVKEEMATASGNSKEAKEWAAMAQKAAQDAKLNVSQLSKSDISGGVDLLTQLSEAVESELSVIPLLPKVLEQPYDDVDVILWSTINYNRRLEDKPTVSYRDVWSFYDEMIDEHCSQKGMSEKEKEDFINKRKGVFRNLGEVYVEPLYEEDES